MKLGVSFMAETATVEHIYTAIAPEAPTAQLPAVRQDRAPRTAKPKTVTNYPGRIAVAILKITNAIGQIQKEGRNEFQRYKYTRWEDINERLSPLLGQHGLVIVQSEQSRNLLEENDKGSVLAIIYHFLLVNENGDVWGPIEWTAIARLRDQKGVTDDKAASKCHTQAEKQFCIKQFKIRTDDYDAADSHQTLPKKDARDIYSKLQAEIDAIQSVVELGVWGKENSERISVLPNDWQQILRERFAEKRGDLENQMRGVAEETGEVA
jgi:ERF superfamily